MDSEWEGERVGRTERVPLKHTHYHMQNQTASGSLPYKAGSSNQALCDNLEGWYGVGGRFEKERT